LKVSSEALTYCGLLRNDTVLKSGSSVTNFSKESAASTLKMAIMCRTMRRYVIPNRWCSLTKQQVVISPRTQCDFSEI